MATQEVTGTELARIAEAAVARQKERARQEAADREAREQRELIEFCEKIEKENLNAFRNVLLAAAQEGKRTAHLTLFHLISEDEREVKHYKAAEHLCAIFQRDGLQAKTRIITDTPHGGSDPMILGARFTYRIEVWW